jgi:hypothetical protein
VLALDEVQRASQKLFVDGLHTLGVQRTSVFDLLRAVWLSPAMEDATRPELFLKFRVLRVVGILRLLLGVQVVEVAVELVEAMKGGQKFVPVAKMILAELASGVA